MKQGDAGTALYIVQEGILDVALESGDHVKLRTGDSFGELALLYDTPRAATIAAAKDCLLWVLTRPDYKLITSLAYKARIEEYSQMLSKIPCLAKMVNEAHLDMLADVLEKVTFYDEEEICCEGEDDGMLFIIYEGEAEVLIQGEVERALEKGDWVGEEQVINNSPATVTVKPTMDAVTALVLDTQSLVTVVKVQSEMQKSSHWMTMSDNMKHVAAQRPSLAVTNTHLDHVAKNDFADEFLRKRMGRQINKMRSCQMGTLDEAGVEYDITTMKRICVLGEGTFGSVVLMEDTESDRKYALKALSKEHITEEKMGPMVVNERNIQLMLDSEFVVKLSQTYQDERYLYFLLEPVLGGELFDVYNDNDLWGKIPAARFYFGCVTLGLQHMHTKRVVYRDLKLENCILDSMGYLKLTDMGIAKVVMGKTYTVCGTADYFAPETLRQCGHDRAVDWWAAGVLMFIMMTGRSPFDAPQVTQIYKNIMKGFSKVSFPATVPSDCSDVIKSLCRKKPEERVPMQKGGVATLQEMGFFNSFDWDMLARKAAESPLVPPEFNVERFKDKTLTRELNLRVDEILDWDGSLPDVNGE
jgi:CRP-like cAMP-binding protein